MSETSSLTDRRCWHVLGLAAALVCGLSVFLLGIPSKAQAHPGPFHIDKLRATVVEANGLQWVQLRATVCFRSAAEAENRFPDEFRVRQFLVYKGKWTPILTVIKPSPWIVPFGESWRGKACGPVEYRTLFEGAEGFAGFDSDINCLGVEFSIKSGARRATKRMTVRCGT